MTAHIHYICTAARTGGTWLNTMLNSTRLLTAKQWADRARYRDKYSSAAAYADYLRNMPCNLAIKLTARQWDVFTPHIRPSNPVLLWRNDLWAMVVSKIRAQKTRIYESLPGVQCPDVPIADDEAERYARIYRSTWEQWQQRLTEHNTLTVWYEDMAADPVGVVYSVLNHWGYDTAGVRVNTHRTVILRNETSERQASRLRERFGEWRFA